MSWRRVGRWLAPVAGVLGVFVLWGAIVRVFDVKPWVVPAPQDALRAVGDNWDVLRPLTWVTVKETAIGFVVGAVLGFVLAVLMSRWSLVRRVVYPVLVGSQAIPVVAIAAPLVLILGFGLGPKIAIVAFIVFFPVVVNVLDGLASVDRDLLNLARIMDARPLRRFLLIELPATYTPLFSALKLGATYAVTGAVLGEWTGGTTPGLGSYLLIQNSKYNIDAVYAAVLLLTAIGVTGFLLIVLAERLATPWRTRSTARRWRPRSDPAPMREDVVGGQGGRP